MAILVSVNVVLKILMTIRKIVQCKINILITSKEFNFIINHAQFLFNNYYNSISSNFFQ